MGIFADSSVTFVWFFPLHSCSYLTLQTVKYPNLSSWFIPNTLIFRVFFNIPLKFSFAIDKYLYFLLGLWIKKCVFFCSKNQSSRYQNENQYYSKYWPLEAMTFSHLSGNLRDPSKQNFSGFRVKKCVLLKSNYIACVIYSNY